MALVELDADLLYCCGRCKTPKARAEFSPHRRGEDGRVLRWDSVCRTCRRLLSAERNGAVRARAKVYHREQPGPSLPAAPFREWLRLVLVREGAWDRTEDRPRGADRVRSIGSLARDWGVSEKRIYDVMNGLDTVSFSMADKCTTRAGEPFALAELYDIDAYLQTDQLLEAV